MKFSVKRRFVIIKSHNKPGFYPLSRRYIFAKTTERGQIEPLPPPSQLRVTSITSCKLEFSF